MRIEEQPGHRFRLTLADGPVPAARDFELVWTPDVGAAPGDRALHRDQGRQDVRAADGVAAVDVRRRHAAAPARNHVHHRHVGLDGRRLDRAGARRAAAGARPAAAGRPVQRHRIQFDDHAAVCRAGRRSTRATLARAKQFVGSLRARGGTEMLPALKIALAGDAHVVAAAPGRVPDRRRRRQRRRDPAARSTTRSATGAFSPSASAPRPTRSS